MQYFSWWYSSYQPSLEYLTKDLFIAVFLVFSNESKDFLSGVEHIYESSNLNFMMYNNLYVIFIVFIWALFY